MQPSESSSSSSSSSDEPQKNNKATTSTTKTPVSTQAQPKVNSITSTPEPIKNLKKVNPTPLPDENHPVEKKIPNKTIPVKETSSVENQAIKNNKNPQISTPPINNPQNNKQTLVISKTEPKTPPSEEDKEPPAKKKALEAPIVNKINIKTEPLNETPPAAPLQPNVVPRLPQKSISTNGFCNDDFSFLNSQIGYCDFNNKSTCGDTNVEPLLNVYKKNLS